MVLNKPKHPNYHDHHFLQRVESREVTNQVCSNHHYTVRGKQGGREDRITCDVVTTQNQVSIRVDNNKTILPHQSHETHTQEDD